MTEFRPPSDCPVCDDSLVLTGLGCRSCGTTLNGEFSTCEFCALETSDLDVLRVFLASRGNLKDLARHLDVSYPTARARFDKLLGRLGISTEADPTTATLEALARGELTVDEADQALS